MEAVGPFETSVNIHRSTPH